MTCRVVAYVDGFNLYHGLTDLKRRDPGALPNKRIDLRALVSGHLLHEGEGLSAVRWYSAIPAENWRDPEQKARVLRHKAYRAALETSGVSCRISGFRKRPIVCKHCGRRHRVPQEKESDARCSLEIIEDAVFDRMDRALILSSDSDFVPVLHSLARIAGRGRPVDAVVCPPIRREGAAKELRETCERLFGTATRFMRERQLRSAVFPLDDERPDGPT